jgi:hypothetical protein
MNATMIDQARLIAAGWQQTRSNRWWHESIPGAAGRRRLFTLADALGLLDASEAVYSAEEEAPRAS